LDARLEGDAPTDIECGASGGRDGHAVDPLHLAGASTSSLCTISIGGGRLIVWTNSAGRPGSIHLQPNIAAADEPAITPRRRDHNKAARAR